MSDILREVDEDLRQLQLKQFWEENRLWIFGGILLAIVATGGMTFWRGHVQDQNIQATGQLMAALQSPAQIEKLAEDPAALRRPGHKALARLAGAEAYLEQGQKDKAVALFDQLAADRSAPQLLRDLAKLYSIGQRLDSAPADQLEKEIAPLVAKGQAWRYSALEMQALLFARENRMKEAADALAEISGDPLAPQDARTRAFTLHELYHADAAAVAPAKTQK